MKKSFNLVALIIAAFIMCSCSLNPVDIEVQEDTDMTGNAKELLRIVPGTYTITPSAADDGYRLDFKVKLELKSGEMAEHAWMLDTIMPKIQFVNSDGKEIEGALAISEESRKGVDSMLISDPGTTTEAVFSIIADKSTCANILDNAKGLVARSFNVIPYALEETFTGEGALSGRYGIKMRIDFKRDGKVNGFYFYTSQRKAIKLQGRYEYRKDQKKFYVDFEELTEHGNTGAFTGYYTSNNYSGEFYARHRFNTYTFNVNKIDNDTDFGNIRTENLEYYPDDYEFAIGFYRFDYSKLRWD